MSRDAWLAAISVVVLVAVLAAVWVVPKFLAAARVVAGADDLFDVQADDASGETEDPSGGAR